MANQIKIEMPGGQSFIAEIEGDTPSIAEELRIAEIVSQRRRELALTEARSQQTADQEIREEFDTTSGIPLFGLRASLSTAETAGDEEAQLKNIYGLSEGDYTRDRRGRLAITPSGGQKLGIELDRPTLIDEEGFSRYDISADIAGIVPETGGSVTGALMGAPLGLPGMLGGSIIGAIVGAGVEEGAEYLAGAQDQTFPEVAQGLATEGLITGAFDVTMLGAGKLFKLGKGMIRGRTLPEEELRAAGESLTLTSKTATGEIVETPIIPKPGAVGAPSLFSRLVEIGEKALGGSPRTRANYKNLMTAIGNFKARAGVTDATLRDAIDVGDMTVDRVMAAKADLQSAEKEARDAVVNEFFSITDDFVNAAQRGLAINDEAFRILGSTFKSFDDLSAREFSFIDDLVRTGAGSAEIIDTTSLKPLIGQLQRDYASSIAASAALPTPVARAPEKTAKAIIDGLRALPEKASFSQIYNVRKTLNDAKMFLDTSTGEELVKKAVSLLDQKTSPEAIRSYIASSGADLTDEGVKALENAAESLSKARGFFKSGQTAIDNLQSAIGLKSLQKDVANNTIPAQVDFYKKFIVNGQPEALNRALKVVTKFGNKAKAEEFRSLLATKFIDDAVKKAIPEGIEGGKFVGSKFNEQIQALGKTADVLFGADASKIRALGKQIERSSISNMPEDAIMRAVSVEGGFEQIPNLLRAVRDSQVEYAKFLEKRALSELSSGNIRDVAAANYINSPTANATKVREIMEFFAQRNDTQAITNIRASYMDNLMSGLSNEAFIDGNALKAFSDNFSKAAKDGKFSLIFGSEMGADMNTFANVLAINAKKAQGGDLIAANIAATPFDNLDKLLKFSIVGRLLRHAPFYDRAVKDYKALLAAERGEAVETAGPRILGQVIGRLLTQSMAQLGQEGVRNAERELEALMGRTGVSEQLSNLQSSIESRMQAPSGASSIGQVDVTSPLSPNVSPVGDAQPDLRQLASQDPFVAQTLGIRGPTAGLLG